MKINVIVKVFLIALIALSIVFCSKVLFASSKQTTVTGKVTDASDKSPLPFASVVVKGTSIGVNADEKGEYSINVPANKTTLVFSSVGYIDAEVKIEGRTVINVSLKADEAKLEEVVVVGYGTAKKVGATVSAVATVQTGKITLDASGNRSYSRNKSYEASSPYNSNYYNNLNSEEYGSFTENKFQLAKEVPLSTFSVDVDAASYSNVRRYINQGQIPPKDAVRTEELINYFNYNYPQPSGKHPINVITEISECPWNSQNRLVHLGVKAKDVPIDKLPGSNLVFLIDVSGSMSSSNRLPLVKSSMKMLVAQLRSIDKVAIVTYAGNAGVELESTSGNNKQKINAAIDKLHANGSTAGGAGIVLAYEMAKKNFIKGGNNRVILATDGDFNIGVSSNDGLEKLIEKERQSGVFLTVLGYGMGNYKDSKMQVLAQKGNGNHAYIDNLTEAKKVLVNEFGGTLFTIAKDVKLQLEFNHAKVQAYRLIGYESRLLNKEDFNDDTKDAGEMGTGHTVTALYEIIPVGVKSNILGSVDELKYQQTSTENIIKNTSNELLTVKIRYKAPDGDVSERIDVPVEDKGLSLLQTSDNFRFSAAVAQVGMLLHNSAYKAESSYKSAISLAKKAYGNDDEGYRHEFVKLVENLQLMTENNNE